MSDTKNAIWQLFEIMSLRKLNRLDTSFDPEFTHFKNTVNTLDIIIATRLYLVTIASTTEEKNEALKRFNDLLSNDYENFKTAICSTVLTAPISLDSDTMPTHNQFLELQKLAGEILDLIRYQSKTDDGTITVTRLDSKKRPKLKS